MSRFVRPETVKLDISKGDWLIVKKQLTAGEQRECFRRMMVLSTDGQHVPYLDPVQNGISKIVEYLIDWGGPGLEEMVIRDKQKSEVTSVLNSLDTDSFAEILRAIELHESEQDTERMRAKNSPDGGNESSATSPSVSVLAGA